MALKAYVNGSMKRMTRHQMVTFIGGVKKRVPKGVTFINGEKKILWQIGNVEFNSWTLAELQYPYTSSTSTVVNAMDVDENKVVYNVDKYVARANIVNVSAPYGENTVEYGGVTFRKTTSNVTNSFFDCNKITSTTSVIGSSSYYTLTLTCNQIDINKSDMSVIASQTATSSKSGSGMVVIGKGYYDDIIDTGNAYGMVRIVGVSGGYEIYKNYSLSAKTLVASISCFGYSISGTLVPPTVYTIYDNRYLILASTYKATSDSDVKYFLKKVDLSNGTVTNLISNQDNPVTAVLVDGSSLIVTINNTMLKMNMSGTIQATYTSSNEIPTLVGKYGNYYYLTTTRAETDADYMNIEIVDESDFSTGEVIQTNNKMIDTFVMPYESENGYLCFATRFYTVSVSTGSGGTVPNPTSRRASIRIIGVGGSYVTYSNLEIRICRIKCY